MARSGTRPALKEDCMHVHTETSKLLDEAWRWPKQSKESGPGCSESGMVGGAPAAVAHALNPTQIP